MENIDWSFGIALFASHTLIAHLQRLPLWFNPNYLVDLSSLLTLISFSVQSMVVLRLIAIGAQLTVIPYFLMQPAPLWTPVIWQLLFVTVNLVNLTVLLLEKRPIVLTQEQQHLYDLAFDTLSPREFLKLLSLGEWQDGVAGDQIVSSGQQSHYVSVLSCGEAVAIVDETELATIPEGKLLGISSVWAREPMPFGVKLKTPSRYVRWSAARLRHFANKHPEIREKLQLIVSRKLVETVRALEEFQLKEWQQANDDRSTSPGRDRSVETVHLTGSPDAAAS